MDTLGPTKSVLIIHINFLGQFLISLCMGGLKESTDIHLQCICEKWDTNKCHVYTKI